MVLDVLCQNDYNHLAPKGFGPTKIHKILLGLPDGPIESMFQSAVAEMGVDDGSIYENAWDSFVINHEEPADDMQGDIDDRVQWSCHLAGSG